jgi:hypothetical protein
MSNFRHHFIIVLDGVKHDIVTSARDVAAIDTEASPVIQSWQVLHAACLRLKVPGTPRGSWEDFADLLDDMTDLEPDLTAADAMDPTRETVSAG